MHKLMTKQEFPIYYIVEAAVNPDDIQTTILTENTVESATGGIVKTVTADAVLQSFNIINWNGRTYPAKVVMRALNENPKIQNDIRNRQFAGEYCHPDSKDMSRQSQVLGPFTSHYIDSYRQEGNLLKAHVTTAPYGFGLYMYNSLIAGRPWGFSLRAFGGVDSNQQAIWPLTVITYDQVNRPSHNNAYATAETIVTAQAFNDTFLRECSMMNLLESSKIVNDITNFVLEKSDNVKIAQELFGLQESQAVFNEKNQVILEGSYLGTSIKVFVPVENYIKQNYRNMLKGLQ
jgi:hypothetical protein